MTFTVKLYDPKGQQIEVGVSNLFVGTSGSLGASSWLDKNLNHHFIRGYFDGDGYIGTVINSKGYLKTGLL